MIRFLHPGYLYAAAAASAVVVALHFLVSEQPRAGVLPTVRFFPDVEVRSTALTLRLSDLLLLLLRVLTLLLIGAAFAQPQLKPSRSTVLRLLAVDVSRAMDRPSELRDSAANYTSTAESVILFDSVATGMSPLAATKSLAALTSKSLNGAGKRGSLSSALIVGLRDASRNRERADSIELVLVSPMAAEEVDSATTTIRSLWPGRIDIVRVAPAHETISAPRSATIEWADSASSSRWLARARPDTAGAVRFDGGVLVYPFVRRWELAQTDSGDRVIARWADGEAAIVETPIAGGCRRSVSVPMPATGDAILRPSFARFLQSLNAQCVPAQSYLPASAEQSAMIAGPNHLAATSSIRPESRRMTPLVPWLLGAALALALLELLLRRGGERTRTKRDEYAAAGATGEYPTGRVA